MFEATAKPKKRRAIDITQGAPSQGGFKKGYQSFVSDSRTPLDALNDMTNATLDQDNLPRPRESLVLFGEQPTGTILGAGTFVKVVAGQPEMWDIFMMVSGGVGKVCVRKNGATITAAGGTNSYSTTATATFCQSGNRVYVSNASDKMSYYNILTGNMVVYSSLATPATPTATGTGLVGTNYTYYYRITANNSVGESAASVADTEQVSTVRDAWASATQYVTVTWSAVAGATSYNIYVGTVAGSEQYLTSTTGLTFKDDGTLQLNAFKLAPAGNSTDGPVLAYMWNKDGQLFGVGDINNRDYMWYDGGATAVGDFSPFNGGGNVGINSGGDTVPEAVRTFRTGKGDPAVTVLSRGIGGIGKMHHVVFTTTTFDSNVITVPNVTEANGQGGTVSARAVLEVNNSLVYPTGQDFKSTGTAANVQNILSTNSVSNDIIPDVQKLNLRAMRGSCGALFEGKAYWCLPVSSDSNNQIWVKDYTRGGIWIMPWTISAKFIWVTENNTSGDVNLCIYDGSHILTFSRSVFTQDNGVPFRSRVAHEGVVWSESGMTMGAIQETRFKYLFPAGAVQTNVFGLDEDGQVDTLATDTFTQSASFTGWGQMLWSDGTYPSVWSGDVGAIDFTTKQVHVTTLEIDETLNQIGWEVITDEANADYLLSTVNTRGIEIPNSYYGD